ncbi:serine hydrolase domain-containing protein [Nonomuraea rubra]|uniref:serine hydrolase domain-containing protein n=1 Tax=Nonomuraea rubra TaxID=46180 RepID=UPI0031ED8041
MLQQVARGTVELDAPISRYLPDVVPGERGERITVRMLLNHTSHIADHVGPAFPSLLQGSAQSLDDNRFRVFTREELVRLGLDAAPTGEPGATPGSYSNTNYLIAGLLLEKVTGQGAEEYITRNVIRKAGLRHTSFPRTPHIPGPHSKAYESLYGWVDPPRDYSVYSPTWITTAGSMVSTMDDLNRFYRALLRGELIGAAELAEMKRTVPRAGGRRAELRPRPLLLRPALRPVLGAQRRRLRHGHGVDDQRGRRPTALPRGQPHEVPEPGRERQRRPPPDRLRQRRVLPAGGVRPEHRSPGQGGAAVVRAVRGGPGVGQALRCVPDHCRCVDSSTVDRLRAP